MQARNRQEIYRTFLEFVATDFQKERRTLNRRMKNVFFWCFFMPALISLTFLILIKFDVLPKKTRSFLDWIVLILPVFYSLYILGSEVLIQVPAAFRKGGIATTLGQSLRDGEWRNEVLESMRHAVPASADEWLWIIASYKIDLEAIHYRTRYLTILAGAVFFLLMQGIDLIYDNDTNVTFIKTSLMGWVSASIGDMTQFVGLGLFLILLYLSGSQTYQSLKRYLDCATLLAMKSPK